MEFIDDEKWIEKVVYGFCRQEGIIGTLMEQANLVFFIILFVLRSTPPIECRDDGNEDTLNRIAWSHSFWDFGFISKIKQIGIVGNNYVCAIFENSKKLYVCVHF